MRLSTEEVLYKVIIVVIRTPGCHSPNPFTTPALEAILTGCSPLHVSAVAQSTNHPLVSNEVFNRNFSLIGQDFTFPRIAILLLNEAKLILDNPKNPRLLCEDIHQIFNLLDNLIVIIFDLFPLQRHKLIQA